MAFKVKENVPSFDVTMNLSLKMQVLKALEGILRYYSNFFLPELRGGEGSERREW